MRLQLIKIYDTLTNSFWFLPTVMALLAFAAALGSTALDNSIGSDWVRDIGWIWAGSADGARSVLSTVAGSLMTVISIVFSLTITTLAQTSSHFGPRVLRNFTSDRGNQMVLGTFIATFVYCLLVLRTVRSVEEERFVPYLSVNIGVGLALASLAVLIYFIHHISQTIQAENLIANVGEDFQSSIPHLFPEHVGEDKPDEEVPDDLPWDDAVAVSAAGNGYLQRVDDERLMLLAKRHDLLLKLEKRPGDFVTRTSPLALMLPASQTTDDVKKELCNCFALGPHRTPHQDAQYSIQQLVEIASRALSPGVNEPFTALTCIDWIGASLRGVADRDIPSPLRRDEDNCLRVIAPPLTFERLTETAISPLRIFGANNPEIAKRLLEAIADIAPHIHRESDRSTLLHHARKIGQDMDKVENELDRQRIELQLQETLRALLKTKTRRDAALLKSTQRE